MTPPPRAAGQPIRPGRHQIILEDLAIMADIGFHPFEIGHPQRLLVTVTVTIDLARWPAADTKEESWDYDILRSGILGIVAGRHFNLQETLAQEIFALIAARPGVAALSIWLRKPDVYPDAKSVGIRIESS